ncbi:MAG TPA: hypothetical protein VL330_09895, partial [Actinomycetes bacterium]|nr:hypothetical protein [Actinomycetes bacterium]
MERLAQAQVGGAALVEAGRHHRGPQPGRGQGALQRLVGAGDLDGHIHPGAGVELADAQPQGRVAGWSRTWVAPRSMASWRRVGSGSTANTCWMPSS